MTALVNRRDKWPKASKNPPIADVRLIEMELGHIDQVIVLESESFPIPWSRDAFEYDILNNALAHYYCIVKNGEILGYSGIWLMDTIAHLTTICIKEEFRGLGLGKWLLLKTMEIGASLGTKRFTLEVRESNDTAIKLYESVGYRIVGRREKYYKEIGEDALVMWTGDAPYEG